MKGLQVFLFCCWNYPPFLIKCTMWSGNILRICRRIVQQSRKCSYMLDSWTARQVLNTYSFQGSESPQNKCKRCWESEWLIHCREERLSVLDPMYAQLAKEKMEISRLQYTYAQVRLFSPYYIEERYNVNRLAIICFKLQWYMSSESLASYK